MRLLIPGPVPLETNVREALCQPQEAHYGAEWADLYNGTLDLLADLFATEGEVLCLVGSGSLGLDAVLTSLFSAGDAIIVGVNGFHGQRLAAMANQHGLEVIRVQAEWGSPLLPEQFDQALDHAPNARGMFLVHVETTTGVVNPVQEIGSVARERDILLLADVVASLGGVPFEMDEWGVDAAVCASQKCLSAPPGLAQVALGPRGIQALQERKKDDRGWYLDLETWREYARQWSDWHPTPVTISANHVRALHTALKNLAQEGLESRHIHCRKLMARLRSGVQRIGMSLLVDDPWAAPVVTAVRSPDGVAGEALVVYLEREHDMKVGAGFGPLSGKVIRVGHMTATVTEQDIEDLLRALDEFQLTHSGVGER